MYKKITKIMIIFQITLVIITIFDQNVALASVQPNQVRETQQIIKKNNFIGTVLIIKDGKTYYRTNVGYSNIDKGFKNNQHTIYQLASLEKSITATLMMKAQEEHKLKLTDTLNKYYPKMPYSYNLTLWHLLKMESGYSVSEPDQDLNKAKLIDYLEKNITVNPSKINRWNYSDANYIILASILEKVYHHNYQKILKQKIINPLKLKQTSTKYDKKNLDYAQSYKYESLTNPYQKIELNQAEFDYELGSGQMYSSIEDFYRIQKSIIRGKIIKKGSVDQLRQIDSYSNYNGGLYTDKSNRFYYARGVEQGYDTGFTMSKNGKNAVILFSNRHNPSAGNTISVTQTIYKIMMK